MDLRSFVTFFSNSKYFPIMLPATFLTNIMLVKPLCLSSKSQQSCKSFSEKVVNFLRGALVVPGFKILFSVKMSACMDFRRVNNISEKKIHKALCRVYLVFLTKDRNFVVVDTYAKKTMDEVLHDQSCQIELDGMILPHCSFCNTADRHLFFLDLSW